MHSTPETQPWTSSLLKNLGAVKTIVPAVGEGKLRKYCTALLLAAATAMSGFSSAPVNAGTLPETRAEQAIKIVNAQSNTSNIDPKSALESLHRSGILNTPAARIARFDGLIEASQSLPRLQKIEAVNTFFNQNIDYKEDRQAWNQDDYWATPLETMTKGAGDCEDFAIGKYYALASLGVPITDMKITYVKSSNFKEAHMVLTVTHGDKGNPLVLDNMVNQVEPLSHRTDLMTVYSFNGQGLFLQNSKELLGGTHRLSKWQAVIDKVDAENHLAASPMGGITSLNLGMIKTESVTQAMEQTSVMPAVVPVDKKTVRFEPPTPDLS